MYRYEPLKVITVFYFGETALNFVRHQKINKRDNEMAWLVKVFAGAYMKEGKN